MDFVSDALSSDRRIRALTIVDDFTKESVDIVVDHSISGYYVTRVLVSAWRRDYNEYRPHRALNYQTPVEFAACRRKNLQHDESQQKIA